MAVDGWMLQLDFSAQAYRCSLSMLELFNIKKRVVIHEGLNSERQEVKHWVCCLFISLLSSRFSEESRLNNFSFEGSW